MSMATCHTPDCGNNGVTIDVGDLTYTDDATGQTHTAPVVCGVCGQPITDISAGPDQADQVTQNVEDTV